MLRLDHISKVYPTGEVLKDINWEVKAEEKVGLVGVNGAGKSTQLKIITGAIEPTSGNIVRPASLHLGYLDQEFDLEPTYTVREELWTVFDEAGEVQRALHLLHQEMEHAHGDELDGLIVKLDRLQRRFEALDGYSLETKIDKILPDMGFEPQDGARVALPSADRLVSSFSGGWQMRICLAKILLKKPDILLLDEPTNHLDLATIEWLEKYLKALKIPMVIISHDREFLDRICTKIVETERGVSTTYLGNYSNYLLQKDTVREAQEKAYEMQQKELEKQQAFIDRFRASATRSTQAKSREKQLDKIERIESPLTNLKTFHFKFPPSPRSGLEVVNIKNLSHTFNDNILFLGANLLIERGDKIAILGPNGAGKSTLLKMITGMEQAEEGEVSLGKHNVIPGYFAQNQAEALPLEKLVIDTIHDEVPDWKNEEVRTLLGRFLFTGETVFKAVGALSGGEKARLALAKMLLRPCNLLMLDEPTNHLDIPAKEMLEEAIQHYDGTAIIISHDRYFISRIANKIVEIRDGELIVYHGDYHYYLDKLAAEKAQLEQAAKKSRKQAKSKK